MGWVLLRCKSAGAREEDFNAFRSNFDVLYHRMSMMALLFQGGILIFHSKTFNNYGSGPHVPGNTHSTVSFDAWKGIWDVKLEKDDKTRLGKCLSRITGGLRVVFMDYYKYSIPLLVRNF